MAGNYPDAPGPRMPYDRDGTVVVKVNHSTTTVTPLTAIEIAAMNDDDTDRYGFNGSGVGTQDIALMFYFPELRDLVGYSLQIAGNNPGTPNLWWSNDTTNGLDGIWNSLGVAVRSAVSANDFTKEFLRQYGPPPGLGPIGSQGGLTLLSAPGIKALRYRYSFGNNATPTQIPAFHLFGSISAGPTNNPDRLVLWHPTLNQALGGAHADFGDVPQGSPQSTKQFRIKNNSATLTANTITLVLDAFSNTTPSLLGQHDLSLDGVNFAATQTITSLAPGAISGVCHIRRITASNAALSIWNLRVNIDAATWT